jgi:hypothetical protein
LSRTKGIARNQNTSPITEQQSDDPEAHVNHGTVERRITSPELTFSPASKDIKKRKRRSVMQAVDLQGSDVIEVDESEYDEIGIRIDRSPTIKSTKKRKGVRNISSPSRKSASSEDVQSHLSAQLVTRAFPAKALSGKVVKHPFHSPMNCETT